MHTWAGDTERSCPLKVEHVLPLFPDFAVIDDLKEAICDSLQDYQRHIQALKQGMQVHSITPLSFVALHPYVSFAIPLQRDTRAFGYLRAHTDGRNGP